MTFSSLYSFCLFYEVRYEHCRRLSLSIDDVYCLQIDDPMIRGRAWSFEGISTPTFMFNPLPRNRNHTE